MFNDIDTIYIMKERYQCLMILIQNIYYERKISMFNDIDRIYIMKER